MNKGKSFDAIKVEQSTISAGELFPLDEDDYITDVSEAPISSNSPISEIKATPPTSDNIIDPNSVRGKALQAKRAQAAKASLRKKETSPAVIETPTRTIRSKAISLILGISVGLFVLGGFWYYSRDPNEGVAARVNTTPITDAELADWNHYDHILSAVTPNRQLGNNSQLINQLVNYKLVEQDALKLNSTLNPEAVPAQTLQTTRDNLLKEAKISDEELNKIITKNGLTPARFNELLREATFVTAYEYESLSIKPTDDPNSAETTVQNYLDKLNKVAKVDIYYKLKIGREAPDITLTDTNGKPVRLSDFRGKPVMINFFATWCGPCNDEAPDLVTMENRYKDKDLVLLKVNLQEDTITVKQWNDKFKFNRASLLDPDQAAFTTYQVGPMPTTYFIDKQGVIRSIAIGQMNPGQIQINLGTIF